MAADEPGVNKEVAAAYPRLLHYTTIQGVEGILNSQQLWATRITHLNDYEEHKWFFKGRLPIVIERAAAEAFRALAQEAKGRNIFKVAGGMDGAVAEFKKIVAAMQETTHELNEPFVVSFCGPAAVDPFDGLLSQWRGYGRDGGCAIVLRTTELSAAFAAEERRRLYSFLFLGDVEYYGDPRFEPQYMENKRNEAVIADAVGAFIRTWKSDSFNDAYAPITFLACLHKHKGFREEAEVRLVAIRPMDKMEEAMRRHGDKRDAVQVDVVQRNGSAVPFIRLLGQGKLPIAQIIVGPHPDKLERQTHIKRLLQKAGIDAAVTVSGIPYLGK